MTSNVLLTIAASCVCVSALAAAAQTPAPQVQPTALNPATCLGQPGAGPAPARGGGAGQPPQAAAAPATPAPAPGPRDVTITGIPGIIANGARWTQVWQTTGNNGDGIIAFTDGSLLVNQEDNSAVIRIDPNDHVSVFLSDTNGSGSLSMNRQGRILAVQRLPLPNSPAMGNPSAPKVGGISILYPERGMLADKFVDGSPWMGRPNDLTADSQGGAYVSQGCVYYASPSGTFTLLAENIGTNGIVLSADEKTLYVTNGAALAVFDVAAPGKLANRREWKLEAGGNGDGITVDGQGRVYVSSPAGVQIFNPDGKYLGLIPTPRPISGQVFAGADKRTLYIMGFGAVDRTGKPSAGAGTGRTIYRIPMLAQGLMGRSK